MDRLYNVDEKLDISPTIKELGSFCLESYNYIVTSGLKNVLNDIDPVFTDNNIKISFSDVCMGRVCYPPDTRKNKRIAYPSEARLKLATYLAELNIQLSFEYENKMEYCWRKFFVPAMVKSNLCYLKDLDGPGLVKVKEDVNDPGGYFIIKGKEKIIRHFLVDRRNYPIALAQKRFSKGNCTEYAILVRSVKGNLIFSNIYLHFLKDGNFNIRLHYNFKSFSLHAMLILKALCEKTDNMICMDILRYCRNFPESHLKNMLLDLHQKDVYTQMDAKTLIGKYLYSLNVAPSMSYAQLTDFVFRKALLPHLDTSEEKYEFLCFSLCKLHCVVTNQCGLDDRDNPLFQEVLSCAQIYALILKCGIYHYINSVKKSVQDSISRRKFKFRKDVLQKFCNYFRKLSSDVASSIATGNFRGTLFGLCTDTGYAVDMKRTNVFDLIAQFTAICKFPVPHYAKDGRSFSPEYYGFLCPSQTPEGENCGLLNYLASECKIVSLNDEKLSDKIFFRLGVIPCDDPVVLNGKRQHHPFVMNGRVCGWVHKALIRKLIIRLKRLRNVEESGVPKCTEVVFFEEGLHLQPSIHVFTSSCRFVRKCLNQDTGQEEFIGMFEQVVSLSEMENMDVASLGAKSTHFLSLSACMIPYLEHNQTVRNILSSVKVKQALGMPFYNFNGRADSKTLQLVYAQSPAVSSQVYKDSDFGLYPHGTNVTIAVVSYSGFDMEDAVVLNRASVERGLMHHVVHKTIYYDYEDLANNFGQGVGLSDIELKRDDEGDPFISQFLDEDGLPPVGAWIHPNSPLLSVYCKSIDEFKIYSYTERNVAYITAVRLSGDIPTTKTTIPPNSKKISITYSTRNVPEVGDKFSNSHGSKGICSALIPSEDLPFTAEGLVPDVLLNPHSFPSRMAIGLLFEIAAAKAHLTLGQKCIVQAFQKSKKAYINIGKALEEAGFNKYGTERFFSGTSGEELIADVFCGCAYYLRLHHFAQDKYQVRSVGHMDERTQQPATKVLSGAIKFGEMERDALVSHGASALTLDRLLINSDRCSVYMCTSCHQMISPSPQHPLPEFRSRNVSRRSICELCSRDSSVQVQVPYVLVYLMAELAVVGIKLSFSVREEEEKKKCSPF